MKSFCLIILLLTSLPLAWANSLCEKAGIQALSLQDKKQDSCLKKAQELSRIEVKTLEHITQIHQQVARLFGVEVHELFSAPISIHFFEGAFGALVSSANARHISLGVFPDDEFSINTGVYLHELGHVLAGNRNPRLPAILEDLDHSVLFSETFADLLALTIHGHIITPSGSCLDRVRYISNFQNYDYPQEYFENLSEARLMKCCDSLVKTSSDPQELNLCAAADDFFTRGIEFTHPFDPALVSRKLDDHQIGIPFLSFLNNFSQKSGLSLREIFKRIMFNPHSVESFTCEVKNGDVILRQDVVQAHTATNMVNDLKHSLNNSEKELFEILFQKHVIAKGLAFAQRETPQHVLDKYTELVKPERGMRLSCHK